MKIIVEYEIADKQFADTLVGAFEGGSNYWIKSADRVPYTLDGGLELPVRIVTVDGDGHNLTRAALVRGVKLMMLHSPRLFGAEFPADPNNYDGDASSADVFLQYALLGKLVYG